MLFLCTGNSARSILAEAYLNHAGRGRFEALSAGSHPAGKVNPLALETLTRLGIDVPGLRSKSWDEFARPGAPAVEIVITVCDNVAGEACPLWPGAPVKAHWGVDDPAAATGDARQQRGAFERAFAVLSSRIDRLLALPPDCMEPRALAAALDAIGKQGSSASA